MAATGLLDVDQAHVSANPDGSTTFAATGTPWAVRIWTRIGADGQPFIARMRIDTRGPQAAITTSRLAQLPTAQLLHIATAAAARSRHPNEAYYRMLARPRTTGQRTWDPDHYQRVLAVHQWACDTNRPGGGARAVADLWGVAVDPTVYRWLATARQQSGAAT